MNAHLSLNTRLVIAAHKAGVRAEADNLVDVLVRVQAPERPAGDTRRRPPYGIALVVDRSGSMSGRPIEEARRCSVFVVDGLRADDLVSLTQFDNRVETLVGAAPRGEGEALRRAIAGMFAGGNTNLHGGWLAGASGLADLDAATGLRRVVLLSDGQANEGMVETGAIAAGCREMLARGVTTSTYGLGNNFNEELMVAMAEAGGGNHYYGDTADDLMEPFKQEFALLGDLCLKNVALTATPREGVEVEMLNVYQRAEGGGWRLPDVAWNSEAWCVLRLHVPRARGPKAGERLLLASVQVAGLSLDGEPVSIEQHAIELPVLPAADYEALPKDELVARRLAELDAATVLSKMREAAGARDWKAVAEQLTEAEERFAGNEWVAGVLASMRHLAQAESRERFMKEAMYSSSKMRARLSMIGEHLSLAEGDKPAYLRRKLAEGKAEFDDK